MGDYICGRPNCGCRYLKPEAQPVEGLLPISVDFEFQAPYAHNDILAAVRQAYRYVAERSGYDEVPVKWSDHNPYHNRVIGMDIINPNNLRYRDLIKENNVNNELALVDHRVAQELDKRRADVLVAQKLGMIEAYGDDVYEDGTVFKAKKAFNVGGTEYIYALIKLNGKWFGSGSKCPIQGVEWIELVKWLVAGDVPSKQDNLILMVEMGTVKEAKDLYAIDTEDDEDPFANVLATSAAEPQDGDEEYMG